MFFFFHLSTARLHALGVRSAGASRRQSITMRRESCYSTKWNRSKQTWRATVPSSKYRSATSTGPLTVSTM